MKSQSFAILTVVLFGASAVRVLQASEDSIGPNGINSLGLNLNGMGIAIGQVESARPGKHMFDNDAMCCNQNIVPTDVFVRDMDAEMNESIDDHAMWVAGVMISKQTMVPEPPPVRSPPIGVAQQAALYSSAFLNIDQSLTELQSAAAVAAQHLAKHLAEGSPPVDVRAINMSFGLDFDASSSALDGTSTLTQFVDWSASEHDVLYVVAGNQTPTPQPPGGPVPTDSFNGMTVAYSAKETDGVFRKIGINNDYGPDPSGAGTFTDIVAPGDRLDLAGPNGTFAPLGPNIGTSFAAPHVTGTVALLQQHAENQIDDNVAGWDADARRHQVMKAVLMNSADKIKDDGTMGPVGTFLGMERTVLARLSDDTWLDSSAFSNDNIPLALEMGAGHLNANRALTQFEPGESPVGDFFDGSVSIPQIGPQIGWDYNNGVGDFNKYLIQGNLMQGNYISVTLVWDRIVGLVNDFDNDGEFDAPTGGFPADEFQTFDFDNLDLHVVPAGTVDLETATWKASSTAGADQTTVEHIFDQIPTTGLYEIWVQNSNEVFTAGAYALAWWLTAPPMDEVLGDYNGNGSVGPEDYDVWRKDFGTMTAQADGNGDGVVDAADYVVWRKHFDAMSGSGGEAGAAVPEPAGGVLLLVAVAMIGVRRKSAGRD